MKHIRHIVVCLLVLAAGMIASCGQIPTDVKPASNTADVVPANSIFNTTDDPIVAKLVQQAGKGEYPVEATVQYDQVDGCFKVTVTDADTIKELYQRLCQVQVTGKTNQSITDNYHYLAFVLEDGSRATFSFEGQQIWCQGEQNYSVENGGKLFGLMKELTSGAPGKND